MAYFEIVKEFNSFKACFFTKNVTFLYRNRMQIKKIENFIFFLPLKNKT